MRNIPGPKNRSGHAPLAAADGRPAGWRLYVPLFVTVVLGLTVTAVAFLLVREWEAREAQAQFEKLVDERRETLQRHIKTDLEVLHSLANFFRGSQKVERAEFRTFVEESFVRHPDIFALQWWPRVLRRERRALERAVRAEGFPDFYIKDAARPDAFVRAPERSEYFPILYSEPQDKDPLALGWDLLPQMQPLWERLLAMQQAAGAASAVASGGVKLYQKERDANDPYAVVLCLPVYRHARVPEDDAGRLRDLRGFVVEILRVRELFENALHGYALPGIDMVLLDETPGATVIELYHHRSHPTPVPEPEGWKQLSGMRWKATVELADRRLSVLYLATPEYQGAYPRWGAWTVSTALLIVLSLTSGFLGSSLRRTQRSQGMARALAEEIAQREHSERSLHENEARLQRQTAALMALTSERVIRYLDLGRTLRELTERAAQALDVARVGVWKFSADQSKLECLELYEKDQDRHGAGAELMVAEYPAYVQALKECWGLAADDAPNDPRTREFASNYLAPLGITSMLDAPMRRGVQLVGIVCHEHTGPPRHWTLDEQNFAGSVADLAALALEIAQHEQARRMLEEAREELEARVAERTRELQEANEQLKELGRLKSEFLA
ncbi:MAG: CHASE domain-containing protein, partial [Gammaproteobacteria bacterium]